MNMELQSPDVVADISAGIKESAAAVIVALVHVEETVGAEASATMAELMVMLAVHHLLDRIGPVAARAALIGTFTDLQTEIASQNAGSSALS